MIFFSNLINEVTWRKFHYCQIRTKAGDLAISKLLVLRTLYQFHCLTTVNYTPWFLWLHYLPLLLLLNNGRNYETHCFTNLMASIAT
jgi:hypothetical protein